MANTANFGWETPDDTDLVKDGAASIRTLGSAIDTSMVDLKGGTTGQVLSKTSNTDMDFTWVTTDDANAIQNAIVDAKGDLIAASAADTPARLAVGSNGDTLVADSAATTGLRWQGSYEAGKNKIINGDFNINQRGFTSSTTSATYTFDRWRFAYTNNTVTVSSEAFTPGTAPVAGYESSNYFRCVTSGQTGTDSNATIAQRIEDVRTFAGQTVTISFWAKAASGTPKIHLDLVQNFGSGGSPSSAVTVTGAQVVIGTTWARYSATIAINSISGKTIGTTANTSYLQFGLWFSAGSDYNARTNSMGIQSNTFDIWGVQIESGSVATAFQTATGTLQGELAACQRYFQNIASGNSLTIGNAACYSANNVYGVIPTKVTMRTTPTISQTTGTNYYSLVGNNLSDAFDSFTRINNPSPESVRLDVESGITATQGYAYWYITNNADARISLSAEL